MDDQTPDTIPPTEAEAVGISPQVPAVVEATPEITSVPEKAVESEPVISVKCPKCGEEISQEMFVELVRIKEMIEKSSKDTTAKGNERVIRSQETGDKVYLLRNSHRFWVKNPESLKKLGWALGQEQVIPFAELLKNPEGTPIDLTVPGTEVEKLRETIDTTKDEPKSNEPTKPSRIWSL